MRRSLKETAKARAAMCRSRQTANQGGVQEVSLKVWCPQNQVDSGIMEKQQKAFEAEHPEWKITWTTEVVGEDKCQD